MKTSDVGIALIKKFEGFIPTAYPDPGSKDGLPTTIGYGSTRYEDGRPIKLGERISRERAEELLRHELVQTESAVARLITVPLSQGQFDALVSFTFNVGARALSVSTLRRVLNASDYAGAAEQFLRWNQNDGRVMLGLTRRRQAERDLFLRA